MEVLMSKTKRRALHFDSLEGKVLLSTGLADRAKAAHHADVKRFLLNGSLSGLPNGSPGVNGFTETTFPVSGHLASTGTVNGSFDLKSAFIPVGKLPNLNGASLTLENSKGSIQLAITQSKKQKYDYTVVAGTDDYASKSGAGTMTISSPHSALNLVIRMHSTTVKKA
jgi:hypothetical protein